MYPVFLYVLVFNGMPTYLYVCANRKLGPLYSTSHVGVIMGIMVLTLNYNLLVSKLRSAEGAR